MKRIIIALLSTLLLTGGALGLSQPEAEAAPTCTYFSFSTKCTDWARKKSPTYDRTQCSSVKTAYSMFKGTGSIRSTVAAAISLYGKSVSWLSAFGTGFVISDWHYKYLIGKYCNYWTTVRVECWGGYLQPCTPR